MICFFLLYIEKTYSPTKNSYFISQLPQKVEIYLWKQSKQSHEISRKRIDYGNFINKFTILRLKNKKTSINKIVFIRQVNKTIKEILAEGFSSHSFRQGLITEMGSKSINIKIISQFVGHKNISTTMGYIKPTDEQIRDALVR